MMLTPQDLTARYANCCPSFEAIRTKVICVVHKLLNYSLYTRFNIDDLETVPHAEAVPEFYHVLPKKKKMASQAQQDIPAHDIILVTCHVSPFHNITS
jgi:hypothetical protein